MYRTLIPAILCLSIVANAHAAPFDRVLKEAAPGMTLLFYLHDETMEKHGKGVVSKRYGEYQYDSIIEHFEERGLTVIDEVRGKTNANRYAAKIVMQIRQLQAKGIPSSSIAVAGFSKGGHIAMMVASSLGDSYVSYIILAGCGSGRKAFEYEQFLKRKRGSRLRGRILSMYAGSDMEAGSCLAAYQQTSGQGATFREVRIKSPKGHGLFYQPRPEWITPTALFARGGM